MFLLYLKHSQMVPMDKALYLLLINLFSRVLKIAQDLLHLVPSTFGHLSPSCFLCDNHHTKLQARIHKWVGGNSHHVCHHRCRNSIVKEWKGGRRKGGTQESCHMWANHCCRTPCSPCLAASDSALRLHYRVLVCLLQCLNKYALSILCM